MINRQKLRLAKNLLYFLDCYDEETQTLNFSSKIKQSSFEELEKTIGTKLAVLKNNKLTTTPIGYCILLEAKSIKQLLEKLYNIKNHSL